MIRVTDRRKWRRTKALTCVALWVTAVACAGGLESENGLEPMPSFGGFVVSAALCAMLAYNLFRERLDP